MNDWKNITTPPARQGFYLVEVKGLEQPVVAEWREYDKKVGKRWWQHVGALPTDEKKPQPLGNVVAYAKATQDQINRALARELTVEEKIELAYKQYVQHASLYPAYLENPPPGRRIEVGDELELGNLKNVRAVALREEGRVIVYSHHDVRSVYGKQQDNGTAYSAELWIRLVRKRAPQGPRLVQNSLLTGGFTSGHLWSLLMDVVRGLDSAPDFQRDYVWTEDDQQRYLDSLMAGRDLGRFIIVNRPYPQADVVLDGKQRLNCLMLFLRSEISWRGVFWHEMSPGDRSRLEDRVVQVAKVDEGSYTKADLLRIFLEVNAGGVPQSDEHLAHVRQMLADEENRKAST